MQNSNAYRFLIVEDNPGDRVLIEDYLRVNAALAELTWAESLQGAKNCLSREHAFDAILLDLTLPDCAGQILIETMLKLAGNIPVIVLTGYSNLGFAVHSMGLGISDYLLKDDLDETVLYKSIRYSIERTKYILALKDSEQRYSNLFQMSPQPAWCIDTKTQRFLEVNDAAVVHYGYTRDTFLNMQLKDLCPCPVQCMPQTLTLLAEDGVTVPGFEGVYCHVKKDGQLISVRLKNRLIYRQGEWVCLMLVNDVSLQQAYISNIEQQNQMLQDMVWMQSHMVRAPLARLQGLVHLFQIPDLDVSALRENAELLAAIQTSLEELDEVICSLVRKTEDVQTHIYQSPLFSQSNPLIL